MFYIAHLATNTNTGSLPYTMVTMISNTFGPICYFYGILRSELCIVRPKRNYLRCIVKVMNHYAVNYCALANNT